MMIKVCLLQELDTIKPRKYVVCGTELLLVKSLENSYIFAFENVCPHKDLPLEKGKWDGNTQQITCPFHKAVFCVSQKGAVIKPPACVPLNVYSTEIRQEDHKQWVWVDCG
jgi:nitrite reductase/ring-hydroxylating ferredoxin subunit